MCGSYNPDATAPQWAMSNKDVKGIIPIRWLVLKDVRFSTFDSLAYRGQPVTQLRHANTIPGLVGRLTVKLYFESPHTDVSVLYPTPAGILRSHGSRLSQRQAPMTPHLYQSYRQPLMRQDEPLPLVGCFPRRPVAKHGYNRSPMHFASSRNAECYPSRLPYMNLCPG